MNAGCAVFIMSAFDALANKIVNKSDISSLVVYDSFSMMGVPI